MRKFSDDCRANDSKQACYRKLENMRCEWRPLKTFWTGSTYLGTWNGFGMSGYGIYTYANGAVYEGEFEDNMFHGEGVLKYPNGTSVRGIWVKGVLLKPSSTTVFADGLMFREHDWQYCEKQDRRFSIEYVHKLQPAGMTFLSADGPPREIPEGFYDCSDGFFDPKSNTVYDYNDLSKAIRVPDMTMRDWIMKNCRTSGQLKPLGPQPQLYEEWVNPIYDYVHPTPPPELFTERDFDDVPSSTRNLPPSTINMSAIRFS
ncbi:MORN repeat-containing protein 5-like [Hyposmocoma kahamanoa]|uniref:MORN repeat-containing protein 5-like n=1 Tax=Hyposmocoma kahamanoa TaxID=1477025 RepID=UPI000E6D9B6C|nr:MORN repeat-containing protein 5-like [Hyposmocoma kahamanoa]XP_026319119.1 MORN repeat-containing protein 5-like [Hyposmocoma kahamanoa]